MTRVVWRLVSVINESSKLLSAGEDVIPEFDVFRVSFVSSFRSNSENRQGFLEAWGAYEERVDFLVCHEVAWPL